jgi:hypothetical protein
MKRITITDTLLSLKKYKPEDAIYIRPETTDLGDIIVIYHTNKGAVGNISFIGKPPHCDALLQSSYIDKPIIMPMVDYWDVTLVDCQRIARDILKVIK